MYDTRLEDHYRGTDFTYYFSLGNEWLGSMFDELKFTIRRRIPASNVLNDTNIVGQASLSREQIVFDIDNGALGTVFIPASKNRSWPLGIFPWDFKAKVGDSIYTVDAGTVEIVGDLTRSM